MECAGETDTSSIRVLPDACVELFLNYTSTPVALIENELHQRSIATFRMSRPADVHMRKGSGVIAVCFYPGTAYPFMPVPMNLLSDTATSLEDLWGTVVPDLEEQIAACNNNEARAALVQQSLLKKLHASNPNTQLAHCLKQVQQSKGTVQVEHLACTVGLSQRQLSRTFQKYIGLSPKEYLRVSRFVQSLQYLKTHPAVSLTTIAYESGYYDQAHCIREYRNYTGYTPGQLVRSPHIAY